MPAKDELPGTLERSPKKAQRTWIKAYDSARESYGGGERARRTAYAALKHSFKKEGDHWAPKDHKGPSDPQAARGKHAAREHAGESFNGVDLYGSSKEELYKQAQQMDIKGRSRMNKRELAREIGKRG